MSKVVYKNALKSQEDLTEFIIEGAADISFDQGFMQVVTVTEASIWCPKTFPADIRIDWEFRPIKQPGASELIFAAKKSRDGESLDAFLLSYFIRRNKHEARFHTSCLYKNSEENLLFRGADPVPDASEDLPWYRLSMVKRVSDVFYGINNLEVLHFHDDGLSHGEALTGGNMAIRQSGKCIMQYRNLKVTWI